MYLGIDTGSTSINFALVNDGKIVKTLYLRNQGVIETLQKGLRKFKDYKIEGVGVTGSGRNLTKIIIGTDAVKTEIIAHAVGTLHFYPDVRTIADIGGEDLKLIQLCDGVITDFAMNSLCSSGCGAFLDTISGRMDLPIEKIGDLAIKSKNPVNIAGKCTVFAQSSCVSKLNSGSKKEDVIMGVCNALIRNYLSILARGRDLKEPFVFQGTTALNKGLVKAFEDQLGKKILIPKYPQFMGAIGMALIVAELGLESTKFKGFSVSDVKFVTRLFNCDVCPNNCEITEIKQDKNIVCLGSRCGKY